jgi:hypothetical protein
MVVVLVEIARAATPAVAAGAGFRGNRRAANIGWILAHVAFGKPYNNEATVFRL